MKKFLFILILFPVLLVGQELDATVRVNVEQLESRARENLYNFESIISNYLNNNKFTGSNWEYPRIKCNFEVFFVSAGDQMNYSAQIVISSQRPIYNSQKSSLMFTVLDNSWDFKYEKNQSLYYDPITFNSLTSFLDFYALVIIGFDMDSYGPDPYNGSDMFAKALDIAVRGGSSQYSDGWQTKSTSYNKRGLVDNLMNANYQEFRKNFMIYHFDGLDIYNEDKPRAMNNMAKLAYDLGKKRDKLDPRSVLLKVFFDAKAGEIVDYLRDYPDEDLFNILKKVNPGNISKYDQVLDKR